MMHQSDVVAIHMVNLKEDKDYEVYKTTYQLREALKDEGALYNVITHDFIYGTDWNDKDEPQHIKSTKLYADAIANLMRKEMATGENWEEGLIGGDITDDSQFSKLPKNGWITPSEFTFKFADFFIKPIPVDKYETIKKEDVSDDNTYRYSLKIAETAVGNHPVYLDVYGRVCEGYDGDFEIVTGYDTLKASPYYAYMDINGEEIPCYLPDSVSFQDIDKGIRNAVISDYGVKMNEIQWFPTDEIVKDGPLEYAVGDAPARNDCIVRVDIKPVFENREILINNIAQVCRNDVVVSFIKVPTETLEAVKKLADRDFASIFKDEDLGDLSDITDGTSPADGHEL